jgi:ATPase subunit of ABC transporter with duplicated ATPase domains
MSKLNIYDAALAKKEFDNLTNQINKLKDDNKKSEQDIETLKNEIMSVNNEYSNTMKIILDKTADILKQKGSSEISRLTFKYDTDKLKMFNDMCEFVKTYTNVDKNDFESILKRRTKEQKEVDLMSDILESICEESSDLKSSKKILSFFEVNPRNKKLYDLHYLSCKYNEAKYEMFSIMYQNKELENLSFGQRATAIILTLLLFGNKPLVIDEPETHLDQKLIALELINVIKQVKSDKQIVFATHNANIVINGDSEQIYILKTEPTSNKTSFIQMSIEDMCEKSRQSDLLMLEGSVEAFKHREQKYSLPKDDNCPLK